MEIDYKDLLQKLIMYLEVEVTEQKDEIAKSINSTIIQNYQVILQDIENICFDLILLLKLYTENNKNLTTIQQTELNFIVYNSFLYIKRLQFPNCMSKDMETRDLKIFSTNYLSNCLDNDNIKDLYQETED